MVSRRAMNHQIAVLLEEKKRTLASRTAESGNDADAIAPVYRTLSYLFEAFLVSSVSTIHFYC